MKIGRNAPCPCGSGKKYKACCLKLDRANPGPPGGAPIRVAAARAKVWQVDLLPMPARFEDDPDARPAALMVTADGFVVASEVLARPSPEVEDIATELERGIQKAIASVGSSPREVAVREPEVAAELTALLARSQPPIVAKAAPLPDLEAAMAALNQSFGDSPMAFSPSRPLTWAGWGHPEDWIANVFRLSAAFYRASPWTDFEEFPPIVAEMPDGDVWILSILGNGKTTFGLVLYSDPNDYAQILEGNADSPSGRVLALTFDRARDLPRPSRKEVARAGWEIASADAYPVLMALGTPAGGIRSTDAQSLLSVLAAVTAWAELASREGKAICQKPWRHTETGIELVSQYIEPPPPLVLAPGNAEGPAARPEAVLARQPYDGRGPDLDIDEWHDRFAAELIKQDLSQKTVAAHAANAALFLDYLTNWAGVPLISVHEFDLRSFLFDWYPRKVVTSKTDAARMLVSLRRFFDFLRLRESIFCPWTAEILRDKKSFMTRWQTSPGGPWWEDDVAEWQSEHFYELDRRVLIPNLEVPGILTWAPQQGMVEAVLNSELHRRWLIWRDQVIRSGIYDSDEVYEALCQREASWLETPHPEHGGKTPVEAILAERAAQDRRS